MFARYAREDWKVWGNEADADVAPKGQTHKRYVGGALDTVPPLERHERTSDWLSKRIAGILADEYERGASIQQLAADTEEQNNHRSTN